MPVFDHKPAVRLLYILLCCLFHRVFSFILSCLATRVYKSGRQKKQKKKSNNIPAPISFSLPLLHSVTDQRRTMVSTAQATDSAALRPQRYLASDFQRLTLRRRLSSPHLPSPDSQRAHEPPFEAERTRSVDKRTIESRNSSLVGGTSQVSRPSSISSSAGSGSLKQCVAEDNHGTSTSSLGVIPRARLFYLTST